MGFRKFFLTSWSSLFRCFCAESKTRWLIFSFHHLYGLGLLFSSSILSSSGLIVIGLGVHFPSVGRGRNPRKSAFRVHKSYTCPDGLSQFQMLFSAGFPSFSVASSWSLLFSGISNALLLLPFSFSHRLQNHKDVGMICGFPPPTLFQGLRGCHVASFAINVVCCYTEIQIK